MRKYSKPDLYRYYKDVSYKTFLKAWFIPGYRYTFFYRIAQAKGKKSIAGSIAWLLLRKYSFKYGIQIPYVTNIGAGFYIGHFGNIVVNAKARIGNNCNISQGVTIGGAYRGKLEGVPVIGDDVWIGANAIVVGNIQIGNDVLIAPGAYVNFNVPDHSIVMGNPGTFREKDNATEGYINNKFIG
jgi:serine O-acetyltransferase